MALNGETALLADLKGRLMEIEDLGSSASLLGWDEAVFMPSAGARVRARQKARLAALTHQKATDPALGRLLDRLAAFAGSLPEDAALIRVARRDFDLATRVPAEYVARASEHGSASYNVWVGARPANDFAATMPYLETTLELSREFAEFFPGYEHVMDPLIGPDEGFTASEIAALFAALQAELRPLVNAIAEKPVVCDRCLHQTFPPAQQLAFATKIAVDFGYDLKRGRIDLSPHPFCTVFARDDVRITTRVKENDLSDALFSVLHEVGHALYEMGLTRAPHRCQNAAQGRHGPGRKAGLEFLMNGWGTHIFKKASSALTLRQNLFERRLHRGWRNAKGFQSGQACRGGGVHFHKLHLASAQL